MSDLYFTRGPVYLDGEFRDQPVSIRGGKIVGIGQPNDNLPVCDLHGRMLVPGFIDVHTHGGSGVDVNAATYKGLCHLAKFFASQGTTSFLASVLTDTPEQTLTALTEIVKGVRQGTGGANLLGAHLEGPFLAPEYKGAMPESLLRKADLDLLYEYLDAGEGVVRYITVSPEVEGIPEMIPLIVKHGVAVAIGHSGADYDSAMLCIQNGASAATHTFNAMKLLHQHFPAIMGAVLESDVYCEAICDGRHLHPGVVRLLLKTKGYDRVVAVTDSIMAAGLPDGEYKLGVNDVVVRDGDATLKVGGSRAGSTLTTGQALRNLVQFTGKPVETVLPLLTQNPARLLHLEDSKGSIDEGKDADFVVLDQDFSVQATIVGGVTVYHAE